MLSAIVKVRSYDSSLIEARALLDTCATANFITEGLVKRLRCRIEETNQIVKGIDGARVVARGSVQLVVHSRVNDFEKRLNFLVIKVIADRTPSTLFPRGNIEIPKNLKLADPAFHCPRPVDVLIGSGATLSLFSVGQVNLSSDACDLYLQKTLFGWVIAGGISNASTEVVQCNLLDLSNQISRFWELEDVSSAEAAPSSEEACELHYQTHVQRLENGRYMVRLPFKSPVDSLGNSQVRALCRFKSLERKFRKDPQYYAQYSAVMGDYLEQDHMSLVGSQTDGYFLPHHAVLKPGSSTTKLRVVLDASAKTDLGISLNSQLHIGPTIQPKLFETLLRFRLHQFVVTADIQQMYRQILIRPDDRKYQRLLWYNCNQVDTFELKTVTFGVASAPFLAIRTLHQLANDEREVYPLASEVLKRDFYVDDLLTGSDSLSTLISTRDELRSSLNKGGFVIRKWTSNKLEALEGLPSALRDEESNKVIDSMHKTLGVAWNSTRDCFGFGTQAVDMTKKCTKRRILSDIAKIFDPLGFLGPVVLMAKLVMQDCWKAKIGWDESVPQQLQTRWYSFARQLHELDAVSIPRLLLLPNRADVQIHGFCDASKVGYGAALYFRSVDYTGEVLTRLACSKSRVAPVSSTTLPRLKLCGALTLSRLFKECYKSFHFDFSRVVFWCDSEIALQWLIKEEEKLDLFVRNRVREIRRMPVAVEWRHIPGKNNISDRLSRGQTPSVFVTGGDWFSSPEWLSADETEWPAPTNGIAFEIPRVTEELCFVSQVQHAEKADERPSYVHCSSYNRLVNAIAYCFRWKRSFDRGKPISVQERRNAELRLVGWVQRTHYQKDIARLSQNLQLKDSRLLSLSPFLDEEKLLRVGGRLKRSQLTDDQKHPLLLPANNHVTRLIIREAHLQALHAGVQATLYHLRNKFWILDGKNRVRKIVQECVKCIRFRPRPIQAKMSDLPDFRVRQSPVFSHVGVDYFGPISTKEKKSRNRVILKSYGCVFICMATKAVHLEIVSDLSTEGFLAALRRFIGRRGIPTNIYSDNGTNFVGANNKLTEIFRFLQENAVKEAIYDFSTQRNIKWHFNPPLSPHFGGIWEACVKSAKHHFNRVINGQTLIFEQLTTLFIEIEAILNSRPIGLMSSDPNDPACLTPAHFLIGRPFTVLPNKDFSLIPDNRLSIWNFISKARGDFWRRWHLEYLSELQKRQKWLENPEAIKIGTVVLVIDKNMDCCQWPLGVVFEVCPGSNGVIRVVKIRTKSGEFTRKITRLCPLFKN